MHNVFKNTMTPRADRVLRRKRDPWGNLFQLLLPKALKIPTGRFSDLIHFVTFPSLRQWFAETKHVKNLTAAGTVPDLHRIPFYAGSERTDITSRLQS